MTEKAFSELLNLLFESAVYSCSYVPEEFHEDILKGALYYAFEKLSNGEIEKKKIIVKVYEKISGYSFNDELIDSYDSE